MAKIKITNIKDKKVWEEFVLSQEPDSFLQSWNWGESNKGFGEKVIRKGFFRNDNLVGVMQLIKQDAKRGKHFLLPGGPLIDFEDVDLVNAFINEIKLIAKKEKAWFVRVRSELLDNEKNQNMFEKLGFVNAPMHLHAESTWIVDIDRSDKELLYDMRKNTRYSIRKSLEKKLKLEMTTNPEKVDILYQLQKKTAERHGFVGFPKDYFYHQLKFFERDNQSSLFLIKDKKGTVHVAAIIIFYGKKAYYHHSASTRESRDNYASYFLQWKVIQEARRRGCTKYNLWGVSPDMKNKNHRFYGVTIFKKGFGGQQIDWLQAQDYPTSPLYWTTHAFETIRKLRRGL